jgi:hypothetical protein
VPKTADGNVEMLRTVKVAKDVAVKARTAAMVSLKAAIGTRHRNYASSSRACPR